MMIVDANIIVHALVTSPYSEQARGIFAANLEIAAPDILIGEVANALGKMVRTQVIKRSQAVLFFDTLQQMPIKLIESTPMLANAFSLSLDFNHRFFDCVYIETARLKAVRLLTVDERLIKKFGPSFTNIIHLTDWTP
jgi:predicted nucleic acid-binding protein